LVETFGPAGSDVQHYTMYENALYFVNGGDLWKASGDTEEKISSDITVDGSSFVIANDKLYFLASREGGSNELWQSDGTPEGTKLAGDIFTGIIDGKPALLGYVNDALYFEATDASHGKEIWTLIPLQTKAILEVSSTEICMPEDSLTFTATVTDAGAEPRYQWYINDQAVEGQTSTTFSANNFTDGDEVKVQVIASKDVWVLQDSIFSEAIAVSSSGLAPQISVAGNQLTATEATSYQWYLGGEAITDATSQTLTAQESGSYTVEVSNEAGCTFLSNAVSVIVCTLEASVIQQEGDSLFVEQTGSYQWFLDGEALPDNSQRIEAVESGSYTVEVTDASGCSATSEALEVNITSIEDTRLAREVLTYPNPVSTRLTVDSQMHEAVEIQIYSSDGLLMYENSMTAGSHHLHVALDNFSPGLYIIQLQSKKGLSHRKLIKR
jgi:ELWxxDGT repeat protein